MAINKDNDKRIINLFEARHKGVAWELDKELRDYIISRVHLKMINQYYHTLYYALVPLQHGKNAMDDQDRRLRNAEHTYGNIMNHIERAIRELTHEMINHAVNTGDYSRLSDDLMLNLGMGTIVEQHLNNTEMESFINSAVDNITTILDKLPKELKYLDFLRPPVVKDGEKKKEEKEAI